MFKTSWITLLVLHSVVSGQKSIDAHENYDVPMHFGIALGMTSFVIFFLVVSINFLRWRFIKVTKVMTE